MFQEKLSEDELEILILTSHLIHDPSECSHARIFLAKEENAHAARGALNLLSLREEYLNIIAKENIDDEYEMCIDNGKSEVIQFKDTCDFVSKLKTEDMVNMKKIMFFLTKLYQP